MSLPEQNDWENDSVWNLVDEAKSAEAGPFFVRNVMREVRLSEEKGTSWWQRLLRPKPLLASALGVVVAVVIIANLNSEKPEGPSIAQPGETALPVSSPLDELVAEEMLYQAAEDPSAFTDEALVAMLY